MSLEDTVFSFVNCPVRPRVFLGFLPLKFFFSILGFELRALCLLGRCSII
jgi:hypothetical protein